MIKLEKKQVKIVSLLIAVIFIGSVVALALTQTGNIASAASSSSVGVVDMEQVSSSHPDIQNAVSQLEAFSNEIQKDFEEKAASMSNDQEKAAYYQQCQERFQQKQEELFTPIRQSVEAAIKAVADKKGLAVVVNKMAVVYGGQDITQDVINQLKK